MRAPMLLLTASLLALACAEGPESSEATPRRAVEPERVAASAKGTVEAKPAEPVAPMADELPTPSEQPTEAVVEAPGGEVAELEAPALGERESEGEEDPLEPILPSGPEPGTPEADAELAELLEESTLTQAEFDAAFRGNKPKIHGDQFVFGAGDRKRKRPVVGFGEPEITGSKVSEAEILKLAKAHLRGFEGCLAAALVDTPALDGSGTLRVRFDAKGEVSSAEVDAQSVAASLRVCLGAVADEWSLPPAAGASVELPLSLRAE